MEDAYLERGQEKGPGHAPQGGEGGDDQGNERRHERVDLHAGHGKDHDPPIVNFFTKLIQPDTAVKGLFGGQSRRRGAEPGDMYPFLDLAKRGSKSLALSWKDAPK